jgi:predicted outer membrane repeat protein
MVGLSGPAAALRAQTTWTVTGIGDSGGACTGNSCATLRSAIAAAQNGATIQFGNGLTGTILLTSPLAISKSINITGPATAPGITVDGNLTYQIFQVGSFASVNISNLTIAHGSSISSIENTGTLTVNNSTFSGGAGSAILSNNTLTVTNTTFSGNLATLDEGGGIYNVEGTVTVTNSTFSGNSASGEGGGIYNAAGTATVTNSTFSGNSATGYGGGISNDNGTLTVANSIFSGNSAASYGGGIYSDGGTVNADHNVFYGNTNGDCTNCTSSNSTVATSAILAPLGNYGGPTQTMPPLGAALNAGKFVAGEPATDQRGAPRPSTIGAAIDAGAVQVSGEPPMIGSVTPNHGPTTGNTSVSIFGTGLDALTSVQFGIDPATGITYNSSTLTLTAVSPAAAAAGTVDITATNGSGTSSKESADLFRYYEPLTLQPNTPIILTIGQLGVSVVSVTASGGTAPLIYSVSPALPAGLTLDPGTGAITGSPTVVTPAANYMVKVSDADQSASATVNITISSGALTTTILTMTSNGNQVTTVPSGTAVSLTASVAAGTVPVTAGQVKFCDATTAYCDDIHFVGTAQLTSAGTATMKFIPGIGNHSYFAAFGGTTFDSRSSSNPSGLTVTGSYPTKTTIAATGGVGNYSLTATVNGQVNSPNAVAPSGTVSFLDTNASQAVLGTAVLAAGTGPALSFAISSTPGTNAAPQSVAVADLNGDGKLDLAVSVYGSHTVSVLLGNGDGTFVAAPPVSTPGYSANFSAVGDFNGDGKLDIALTLPNANNGILVLLGNGDGTFNAMPRMPLSLNVWNIAEGDFNQDGKLDLIVTNPDGITVLLGNGDGTFTALPEMQTASGFPMSVAVAELNGDGIPDLAIANYSGLVTVLLGNGDGTFTKTGQVLTAGTNPESIAVGDFNRDGKLDLAVANSYVTASQQGTVSVFLGNGDGTFTPAASLPTGNLPYSVAVGDFNGDDIPDLVTSNVGSNSVSIFLGNGDGTFAAAQSPAAGSDPLFVALGDFNGSGLSGAAVVNNSTSSVTVLLPQLLTSATATATQISPIGQGQHSVDASYPGDSNYLSSVSPAVSLTAQQLTPTITWPTPSSIVYGTPLDANELSASASVQGTFVYSPATGTILGAGSQTLTVTFTPKDTTSYTTATSKVQLMVNTAPLAVTANNASMNYGGAVPVLGGTLVGTIPGDGITASFSTTATTTSVVGVYPITATLNDPNGKLVNYAVTNTPGTLTIGQATPVVTWTAPSSITYGTALSTIQLNASSTVSGTFAYSPVLGTVLPAGSQTLSVNFTPADGTDFSPATKTVQLTVSKAIPGVSLASSTAFQFQSNPVTFNVALGTVATGGLPTGSITFFDGSTPLGSSPLASGAASFTTSSLGIGSHSITAAYSGDSNYAAATSSSSVSETIGAVSITATGSGASVNASPGGQAVFTLTIAPPSGYTFPQAIQLSLSGLPSGANATFSPNPIPSGAGSTTVTLTVSVPTTASVKPLSSPFGNGPLPIALGFLLLPFAVKFRRARRKLQRGGQVLLVAVAAIAITTGLAIGLSGCGGSSNGGSSGGTAPRTYPLTLTATAGTYSQTTTLTLVVK